MKFKALLFGFLCFGVLSCQNSGDQTSFSSAAPVETACVGSSGCASLDSPSLTLARPTTQYAKLSDREIEINGSCYVGDSVSHSIVIGLRKGNAEIGSQFRGLNVGDSANSTLQCSQGRFSFILNIQGLDAGVYTLTGQLTVTKKDGSTESLPSAAFTFSLSLSP